MLRRDASTLISHFRRIRQIYSRISSPRLLSTSTSSSNTTLQLHLQRARQNYARFLATGCVGIGIIGGIVYLNQGSIKCNSLEIYVENSSPPHPHQHRQHQNASPLGILRGIHRILRLMSTVTIMCLDYGFEIYSNRGNEKEYEKLKKELYQIQLEEDKIVAEWIKTAGTPLEESTLRRLNEIRNQITAFSKTLEKNRENSQYSEVHQRGASRLLRLCENNGGVYIKLGQHLAQLDYILPWEYCEKLSKLLDRTPVSSYEEVRETIREDLGFDPEEMWADFGTAPIASASLAQVHVGTDRQGRRIAVKIQHRGLLESSYGDMKTITFAVNIVSKIFGDKFNYNWLAREMNMNLPIELDFEQEAANMQHCAKLLTNLVASGDVAIPRLYMSSKRVLVMSFEEGVYVSNIESWKKMKLNGANISKTISNIFCEQIFTHGFVHCDPHTANLLVRPHPKISGRAQIVLLDHGLYKKLDDKFRRSYCRLWNAIVRSDVNDIKRYCADLKIGEVYPLFAAMLTLRPWDDIVSRDLNKFHNKAVKDDGEALKMYTQKYIYQIVNILQHLDSDMLLLLKTNDCLRHLDKELDTPVNSIITVAEKTSSNILREDMSTVSSWTQGIDILWKYFDVQLRILALEIWGKSR